MKYNIRPIIKDDFEFLWDMLYLCVYVSPGEQLPSRDVLREPTISIYLDDWGRFGDYGFVACIDEKPVGAIWFRLFTDEHPGYGFITKDIPELAMAVVEECRGNGIGTGLMIKGLEKANELGFKAVSLSVDERNQALNLYKRFGFKTEKTVETSATMIKEL